MAHGGNLIEKWPDIKAAVESADTLLVGMSDSAKNSIEEVAACDIADNKGIPFGIFADTYDVVARPW